jgi:hypothetical protein
MGSTKSKTGQVASKASEYSSVEQPLRFQGQINLQDTVTLPFSQEIETIQYIKMIVIVKEGEDSQFLNLIDTSIKKGGSPRFTF